MIIIQTRNYAFVELILFSSNAVLKKKVTMTIYTFFLYFQGIMEWFGLEGILKIIYFQPLSHDPLDQ